MGLFDGSDYGSEFVACLVDLLREKISKDIDIAIVESDASAMKCKYAFKMLGYEKLSKDYDAKLVNLSEDRNDTIKVDMWSTSFYLKVPFNKNRIKQKFSRLINRMLFYMPICHYYFGGGK